MTIASILDYVRSTLVLYVEDADEAWLVHGVGMARSYEEIDAAGDGIWIYAWIGDATVGRISDARTAFELKAPVYIRCRVKGESQHVERRIYELAHDVLRALLRPTSVRNPVRGMLRPDGILEAAVASGEADLLVQLTATLPVHIS